VRSVWIRCGIGPAPLAASVSPLHMAMTENDIARIESRLGIKLPLDYRQFALSPSAQQISTMFSHAQQAIAANEKSRQMSWLGRPLDRAFYIFGVDETGRELFLDLDFPEPPVMLADHEQRRGAVQERTFGEWISRYEHGG
jgi:hypothetical protein